MQVRRCLHRQYVIETPFDGYTFFPFSFPAYVLHPRSLRPRPRCLTMRLLSGPLAAEQRIFSHPRRACAVSSSLCCVPVQLLHLCRLLQCEVQSLDSAHAIDRYTSRVRPSIRAAVAVPSQGRLAVIEPARGFYATEIGNSY